MKCRTFLPAEPPAATGGVYSQTFTKALQLMKLLDVPELARRPPVDHHYSVSSALASKPVLA